MPQNKGKRILILHEENELRFIQNRFLLSGNNISCCLVVVIRTIFLLVQETVQQNIPLWERINDQ